MRNEPNITINKPSALKKIYVHLTNFSPYNWRERTDEFGKYKPSLDYEIDYLKYKIEYGDRLTFSVSGEDIESTFRDSVSSAVGYILGQDFMLEPEYIMNTDDLTLKRLLMFFNLPCVDDFRENFAQYLSMMYGIYCLKKRDVTFKEYIFAHLPKGEAKSLIERVCKYV